MSDQPSSEQSQAPPIETDSGLVVVTQPDGQDQQPAHLTAQRRAQEAEQAGRPAIEERVDAARAASGRA